jgi:hypothetical protein
MKEEKIRVVLLQPGQLSKITEIDASLEGMQKTVGGLIEPFYPFEEEVCMVVNDEGKINGMRPNRAVYGEDGKMMDIICGPAFICDCRGESFASLSEEQLNRYAKQFRFPEQFFRVGDEIKAVPYKPHKDMER